MNLRSHAHGYLVRTYARGMFGSHVFLMSQYRSAFQIKIMGTRAGVNERDGGWEGCVSRSMVSIDGRRGSGDIPQA